MQLLKLKICYVVFLLSSWWQRNKLPLRTAIDLALILHVLINYLFHATEYFTKTNQDFCFETVTNFFTKLSYEV